MILNKSPAFGGIFLFFIYEVIYTKSNHPRKRPFFNSAGYLRIVDLRGWTSTGTSRTSRHLSFLLPNISARTLVDHIFKYCPAGRRISMLCEGHRQNHWITKNSMPYFNPCSLPPAIPESMVHDVIGRIAIGK